MCPLSAIVKKARSSDVHSSSPSRQSGTFIDHRRVMRAAVSIPAVAAASVSHSAAVGGSVVGVVGLL